MELKAIVKKLISTAIKTYDTYEDALRSSGRGYETSELVDVIVLKTKTNGNKIFDNLSLNSSGLSSLSALLYLGQQFKTINVIDLGGSTGLLYHMMRPFLDNNTRLNWCVVESAALAAKSKEVFTTSELRFSDDLEQAIKEAGDLHLVICSGVIQYLPKPYQALETLAASNSRYLLFSRMCFSKRTTDVIILQKSMLSANGYGPLPAGYQDKESYYPQTSIQKEKFLQIFSDQYKATFTFSDDSGVHYPEWQEGFGILLKRARD